MPATFVFDLDGTLVDTAPDLVGALNLVLSLEELKPVTTDELRHMVGHGARALIQKGLASRGRAVSDARFEDLVRAFLAHYELHIADESGLYPDVEAVLDMLADAGHVLAVCTNKPEKLSLLLLEKMGLLPRFAAVCGADTFPVRKPDPAHLTGTIALAGGDVRNAVMIGDSRTDRETAKNAGIPCILLEYGYSDVPARELGAEALIARFADVPKAAAGLLPASGS
ncbi:phosphoglycolate phosphatase, bacterial [Terrihabitans soli]|uniref:Phosphoglycolate phosphatase n=2 Tax=Terrihabitans soli TaxID=708113 RepID=A0A6S6QTI1_9HYPH|nr:phosphoglycolate phosphatase, bacterial [Terrihabitans soli]